MATYRSLESLGIKIGTMEKGPRNLISDVPGVTAGHYTLDDHRHKTGVTVVMPSAENPFLRKHTAACHVLNGYGKSLGLMQVAELGTLETPIAITNTLNVGMVHDALVRYTIGRCREDEYEATSINPLIMECNDGELNDICDPAVTCSHVLSAIKAASPDFLQGDVGAGKGTLCYGWKGGIGSASRVMNIGNRSYTLGVLVQSNYGNPKDLRIMGKPMDGPRAPEKEDVGSIIMVLATDLPLDARQLGRVIRRMGVGMARLGSYIGHGSGEVMVGFTTANPVYHLETRDVLPAEALRESLLNIPFRAAGECCEEAILSSMVCADPVVGYSGKRAESLGLWLATQEGFTCKAGCRRWSLPTRERGLK